MWITGTPELGADGKDYRANFVHAPAVAVSDPASAYNCGDRGVVYCIVRYSYPNSRASETASLTRSAAPFSFTGQRVTTTLPI
jgi:hypothetical protein